MSDKPPFNPNAAFQPVTDSKPAFDPSQPHAVVDQATAAPVDNGNWKKLSQLGGMATPGSEWSMPDDETVNDPTVRQAMKSQAQTGLGIGLGGAAGEVSALGGAGATGAKAALARAGTQGAINAAMNPEHPGQSFATGAALSGALDAVPVVLGAGARKLIQKSAGIREPSPQVGQELLDEGVWGTRGMMSEQARKGIEKNSEKLGEAVANIPGKADVSGLANDLQQRAQDLKINGMLPPTETGLASKYDALAQFLGAKPEMSYPDLRKFKSGQGSAAYNATSGAVKDTAVGTSSSAAERGAGKMLSEAYGRANPGVPNQVDALNQRISALYDARNGLKRPMSLSDLIKGAGALGAGSAVGGIPGAAAGALSRSSIGQSSAAHLANILGKGTEKLSPEMLRALGLYGSDDVKDTGQ
jgi:hypothetical protein